MIPNSKNLLIFLLFFLFGALAIIDMQLTETALENGFYETNEFTNNTSPKFHFYILIACVWLITLFSILFINDNFTIFFLSLLSTVWLINNIWSWLLLLTL